MESRRNGESIAAEGKDINMAVITINGVRHMVPDGTRLSELLTKEEGVVMPCGGHGRCGKCRINAQGKLNTPGPAERRFLSEEDIVQGIRLACFAVAEGDCIVETAVKKPMQVRIKGDMPAFMLSPSFSRYGAAVDIGTTTLAACLYDSRGDLIAEGSCGNPQAGWGADVISRIEAALNGNALVIAGIVREAVNRLLEQMAEEARIACGDIDGLVVTGNTAMLYLFTGTDVDPLSHAPFAIEHRFGETRKAKELELVSLNPDTEVYLPPCISAYVGADLVTSLLASDIWGKTGIRMLVDIGTNGEMVLQKEDGCIVCSVAAGPAFEGAGISCGMQGKCGAVDRVVLRNGQLVPHVIGEKEAVGICGSGVVDGIACLLDAGQIEESGCLEIDPISILPSVALTQKDIRMIQLAKSAVHAGILTLLHVAGISCEAVDELCVAGGFGSYLNVENAGRIGLLPAELVQKVRCIGNAALSGAASILLHQEYRSTCRMYADSARLVELSNDPFFGEAYIENMLFS